MRHFFSGMQALRAVAAISVVIEHAGATAGSYTVAGYSVIIPGFSYGRVGVILFFAISGFVIALQRSTPAWQFGVHRLLRIYPAYWAAIALSTMLVLAIGQSARSGICSITLLPCGAGDSELWIPYWTLAFEMTFYALAALAFALRLSDKTLTAIAALWVIAVQIFGSDPQDSTEYAFPGFPGILLSSVVQVFPMGLICGIHFDKLKNVNRWLYGVAAVAAFAASVHFPELSILKSFFLGLSSSFIILGLADARAPKWLVWLGGSSYGIYLMHFPAMQGALFLSPHQGAALMFIVGISAGAAFGSAEYRLNKMGRTIARD